MPRTQQAILPQGQGIKGSRDQGSDLSGNTHIKQIYSFLQLEVQSRKTSAQHDTFGTKSALHLCDIAAIKQVAHIPCASDKMPCTANIDPTRRPKRRLKRLRRTRPSRRLEVGRQVLLRGPQWPAHTHAEVLLAAHVQYSQA
eukprot:6492524-Amphidinium_carterae.2